MATAEKVQVLDKGFVELIDTFGDDLTVVNAARVSFHKESNAMTVQDEKLIKYLAKHNHITPFFHPQVRLRLKMPIFVAREWYRHQIGFARNEESRRSVDYEPEMYSPSVVRARDVSELAIGRVLVVLIALDQALECRQELRACRAIDGAVID
jgi:thymidylate synthase (FAD)